MNKSAVVFLLACSVFAGSTRVASAQSAATDRGYINLGWGVESGSSAMSDTRTSTIYEEAATITSTSDFTSGSLFDVGVGIRVWRNLTIGGAYHQEQNDTNGRLTGSIPSPVFFNRPRNLDVEVPGLDRKESATHLVIGWMVPIGTKFDVMVFGGPSFFRVNQDTVSEVIISEPGGDFSTVSAAPQITERAKSVTGYHVGVDGTYILWTNDSIRLGAGGFVRFTQASTEIEMLSGSGVSTDLGGIQFGFGGRIRF